jgi:hypothetical protein
MFCRHGAIVKLRLKPVLWILQTKAGALGPDLMLDLPESAWQVEIAAANTLGSGTRLDAG